MKSSVYQALASCRMRTIVVIGLASTVGGCNSFGEEANRRPAPTAKTEAESKTANATLQAPEEHASLNTRAVTPEIQLGIEKHIAAKSSADGGYFSFPYEDRELRLKLVRVHIEYLASLGTDRNFACVDLVDVDGEVYDVDFFLAGPPNDMVVTETTVHKINGKPLYAWDQKEDKTWHRVSMDEASAKLQGVIEDEDTFEFEYRVTLPEMKQAGRMWLPIPISDTYQTVEVLSLQAPSARTMLDDAAHANKILMLDLTPEDSGTTIEMRYAVKRTEKSSYAEALESPDRYLKSDLLIPITDEMKRLGKQAVRGKKTDLTRARALYDHVMDRMAYKKVGDKWGEGDAAYACDSRTGNCSDYHSYFIGISRAVGIPARFAVGAAIPSARDEGGIAGYHCWAEFYADGKWWPIDVSEGDKYTSLSTYYFGHHPANRIELSRGRDLSISPGPVSGPINFLAHPTLEVGGEYVRTKAKFSFRRSASM
ncbi:MAG: transglutaminase domain-containing protein [Myxococcales bacterium]|nr:transglutaminase domain-containing protein [Myxococcales bacterium]